MEKFLTILFPMIVSIISYRLAKKNNRNKTLWAINGFLFGIFALTLLWILNKYYPKKKLELDPPKEPISNQTLSLLDEYNNKFWYYLDNTNNQLGPFSFDAIKSFFHEKKIHSNTHVWNEDFSDWIKLETLNGFKNILIDKS